MDLSNPIKESISFISKVTNNKAYRKFKPILNIELVKNTNYTSPNSNTNDCNNNSSHKFENINNINMKDKQYIAAFEGTPISRSPNHSVLQRNQIVELQNRIQTPFHNRQIYKKKKKLKNFYTSCIKAVNKIPSKIKMKHS